MERFARAVVGGGLLLVAGLWLLDLFAARSAPWLVGAALAVLGVGGLAFGIGTEVRRP
ncbi:MAG: hypothetical protein ABEH78_03730 [Haloferacaceae archaeon]